MHIDDVINVMWSIAAVRAFIPRKVGRFDKQSSRAWRRKSAELRRKAFRFQYKGEFGLVKQCDRPTESSQKSNIMIFTLSTVSYVCVGLHVDEVNLIAWDNFYFRRQCLWSVFNRNRYSGSGRVVLFTVRFYRLHKDEVSFCSDLVSSVLHAHL